MIMGVIASSRMPLLPAKKVWLDEVYVVIYMPSTAWFKVQTETFLSGDLLAKDLVPFCEATRIWYGTS